MRVRVAGTAGAQMPSLAGLGGSDAAATDSVTVNGAMGQTNGLAGYSEDDIRQRVQDAIAQAQRQGGAAGDMANAVVGMLGGMMGGGGFGGPGGGGRRWWWWRRSRWPRRRWRRWWVSWLQSDTTAWSDLLSGWKWSVERGAILRSGSVGRSRARKWSSLRPCPNRFGVSFTGSPFIPGLVKPSSKQFIFFNVTGQRNISPQIFNGTVPTLAERSGDFSALAQTLYDPKTGLPIPGNNLKNAQTPISPQALASAELLSCPERPQRRIAEQLPDSYQRRTECDDRSAALREELRTEQ